MPDIPDDIRDLAERRAQARVDRDYALSDELRDQLAAAGWLIKDRADGYDLAPLPPYEVVPSVDSLAGRSIATDAHAVVGLIVDGWGDDLRDCVERLVAHTDAVVIMLDNASDAGAVVHELALRWPGRVVELHVDRAAGWAAATTALLGLHDARVHVSMDISSLLDGDALTPLVQAVGGDVVAAGWQGADVDTDDAWRSVLAAGPGEVDVLLGYLMAVDRVAAIATPPHPKAAFYRNADLEWSLRLRAAGGRLVVPAADLPVHQGRHHGYHDTDPAARDKASKKTYDRILTEFRGRTDLLHPRG